MSTPGNPDPNPHVDPTRRSGGWWMVLALLAIALIGWYWLGQRQAPAPVDARLPNAPVASEPAARDAVADQSSAPTSTPAAAAPAAPSRPDNSPAVPIPAYRITPAYPVAALRAGASGTVVLRVPVGIGGMPGKIDFASRSGSPELDNAALDAVRQWRFEPALRKGKPVASVVEIPIDFEPPR